MNKTTYSTDNNEFTFENGKSYSMKFKRTTVNHIYEPEYDWYRTEWITAKKLEYHGFIDISQLPDRYSWYRSLGKGKVVCKEMTIEEVKTSSAAYNTWEIQEERAKAEKYKSYTKK